MFLGDHFSISWQNRHPHLQAQQLQQTTALLHRHSTPGRHSNLDAGKCSIALTSAEKETANQAGCSRAPALHATKHLPICASKPTW
jgi:hypothetical protein